MKTYFFIGLFSILSASLSTAQILDVAPSGRQNTRAVLGGGEQVAIDSKTSLINLIQRFEKPWQFVETGKGYWIGYTNDMYFIAAYKDAAIPLLVKFIDTAKNKHARLGGLYTLHLIGINSKIAGRYIEDFSNKSARVALLKYLNDQNINETVVYLLMRDPWLSDLPLLMDYLNKSGVDYSKVLSALQRYEVNEPPVGQRLTDTIFNENLSIATPGYQNVDTYALIAFQKHLGSKFIVDSEITESTIWKTCLKNSSQVAPPHQEFSFDFLVLWNSMSSYCDFIGYSYIFHNHVVEILGIKKTRTVWLDWWKKLDDNQKSKFFSFVHLPIEERFKKN